MSLVILAIKGSNIEQFSKFIEHLGISIATFNSETESQIDQNGFIVKANQILQSHDINALISHILTLGDVLIHDAKGTIFTFTLMFSCR